MRQVQFSRAPLPLFGFKTLLLLAAFAAFVPLSLAKGSGVESLRETGKAFASVARSISPAVVNIQVEGVSPGPSMDQWQTPFRGEWPFSDDLFRRFFGDQFPEIPRGESRPDERRTQGQGSGFIFNVGTHSGSGKTYIITNDHVVRNADSIRVTLQDGRQFDASVTGTDRRSDIAIIEIDATELPTVPLGSSADLDVGEWVVAIGSPFGLRHSLTVGVVSAKGRTGLGINDYEDFIQTDAAINPGNSGGPLVNLDGQVVGMNTAIFSRSGGYMGIGFAIPIDLAKEIAEQLIDHGDVTRGYLGIIIQQLTPELAKAFGSENLQGILVAQVSPDSPASKAGLKQGDVIVTFRNETVTDIGHFRNQVALLRPGSRESLTILRDGKRKNIKITIGKLGADEDALSGRTNKPVEKIGLTVQNLTPQLADQFGVEAGVGVIVTAVTPGSVAARAGIQPGAIVLQVDRKPVNSVTAFDKAINESIKDQSVLLLLQRENVHQYVVLNLR